MKQGDYHQFCGSFPPPPWALLLPGRGALAGALGDRGLLVGLGCGLGRGQHLREEPRDDAMTEGGELGDAMGCVRLARVPREEAAAVGG